MSSSINRRQKSSCLKREIRRHEKRQRVDRDFRWSIEPLEARVVLTNYVVSNVNYSGAGSLGAAIVSANGGDPGNDLITFSLTGSTTIGLTSSDVSSTTTYGATAFVVSGSGVNITIDGSGAPGLTIDGSNMVRAFAIESGSSLTLEDLTVYRSKAEGGAGGNSSTGGAGGGGAGLGGAVYDDGGTFTADGVTFNDNASYGGAGGSISGSAEYGAGGGGFIGAGQNGTGTGAGAGGAGGGGHGGNTGNAGGFGGGGGGGNFGGSGNNGGAGGFGGGGGGGGDMSINVNNGAAGFGGGTGGIGSSNGETVGGEGGGGAGLGGGIFSNNGAITLVNDTFNQCVADGGTGDIAGLGLGGAIFIANGSLTATNVTFYGDTDEGNNSGQANGIDMYVLVDGNGGDGVNGSTASVALNDDILGEPGSSPLTSDFVANVLDSTSSVTMTGSYDLLSNNTPVANPHSGQGNAVAFSGTHLIIADPQLGSLINNGGDTGTRALQAGSPAIAAGVVADYPGTSTPITTDQRGDARNVATPSLGAFEYIPPAPVVTGISPASGPLDGGTLVTITGTNLTYASTVDFGTTAGTNLTVVNSTTITVDDPAGSSGIVDVTVTTIGGTSATSGADNFSYVASPTLSITPTTLDLGTTPAGTPGAEQSYTISGSNLESNVEIVAPVGVQVSDDGGATWASELTEDQTAGTLASTVIEARLFYTMADSGTGYIANDTTGLDPQEVTFSGTIAPAAATQFILTGLVGAAAGTEQVVTVTAEDQYGNVATGYGGTVHFTSTDGQADLPANSTLEDGSGTFDVTLKTVGNQSVTATDTDNPSITVTSTPVPIAAAGAFQLVITGLTGAVAGTEQIATVTAEDRYGNLATGYGGTVHFTSTDGQAVLPADAALDNGSGTFDVTLDTAGNQSVTGAIIGNPSLNSSEANLLITPALASEFVITSDGSSTPEATVIVTAFDLYGNVATGYDGTIHFTSTDPDATLPANSTLADGTGSFVITFATSGTKSVTATDTEIGELTGTGSFAITLGVSGEVYLDENANGSPDDGEPGLAGRVVFLDLNHDGTLDAGDPTTTTDANGNFTLTGGSMGSIVVVEATSQDSSDRWVVDQTVTNSDGTVTIGVVPISPVAPVPVVPDPFSASPSSDPNSAYIQSLYKTVLGRVGADSEVATWLVKMDDEMTHQQVAVGFVNSMEHREDQVSSYYEEFLHRGATDPLSATWVNDLLAGVSEETVVEAILDSPEYQSAHQDSTLFIHDLYLDVLGRQGESAGVASWQADLVSGASREAIVASFVQSTEAIDQIVDSFYVAFLHRQREPVTSDVWVTMLEQPDGSATDVAKGILSDPEFEQDATISQG